MLLVIFCYSWSWISSRSQKKAVSMFLLLFSITVTFADSSYSSMICAKCPTNLALSLSTTTMDLHIKPTVQHSVPLQIRTALMASSGTLLLPSPMLIPSITVVLNLMMSLGFYKDATAMMLDTRSTNSRGLKAKNFTITSRHNCCLIFCWLNEMKKLLSGFQCLVFFGCLVPDVHEGGWGAQEQGRHKNRLYSISFQTKCATSIYF